MKNLINNKPTWVDFTRRNDPACKQAVNQFDVKLKQDGYPDVVCFWSKSPNKVYELYHERINDLQENGTLVLAQFTINNYNSLPARIEPGVHANNIRLENVVGLLGSDHVRIRFDPIIYGYTTPNHFKKTVRICNQHNIKRIIINFLEPKYKHIERRFADNNIIISKANPTDTMKHITIEKLIDMAGDIEVAICAENKQFYGIIPGLKPAMCADREWAISLNPDLGPFKKRPSRKGCGCVYTGDWGIYKNDGGWICPHQCIYCYAQ